MKRENIIASGMCLFIALFALSFWRSCRYTDHGIKEENVGVSWIPKNATEVTFFENYLYDVAEYRIEENNIKKWALERGMKLTSIPTGETRSVIRPRVMLESNALIEELAEPEFTSLDIQDAYFQEYRAELTAGDLYYDDMNDGGRGRVFGYDTTENFAYYFYSSR